MFVCGVCVLSKLCNLTYLHLYWKCVLHHLWNSFKCNIPSFPCCGIHFFKKILNFSAQWEPNCKMPVVGELKTCRDFFIRQVILTLLNITKKSLVFITLCLKTILAACHGISTSVSFCRPSPHCMSEVSVNGGSGSPGLCEGSRLSSFRQRRRWPGEWQGQWHNHLTLEKQSDTKGFNALPWVWATAIGFDSRVIMRGGRLEVFSGRGLEEKRGDVETEKRRGGEHAAGISASAALDVGLSNLLNSQHHTPTARTDSPSQKWQREQSLERTILEVTPTLCFWACFTPDIVIFFHADNNSLFLQQQLIKKMQYQWQCPKHFLSSCMRLLLHLASEISVRWKHLLTNLRQIMKIEHFALKSDT